MPIYKIQDLFLSFGTFLGMDDDKYNITETSGLFS